MRQRYSLASALALLPVLLGGCTIELPPTQSFELHSDHFCFGYPLGTAPQNDLIIRDAYALSSNDTTKFADWASYRIRLENLRKGADRDRNWAVDPALDPNETLEPQDYTGAYRRDRWDRGHLVPLASVQGNARWAESNYLSNITPQQSGLNRGVWLKLEILERELAQREGGLCVVTGPLYEREMPSLPGADEPHRIPSGYWKVLVAEPRSRDQAVRVAGFIFEQDSPKGTEVESGLVSIDEIERRTGLDLLPQLPDLTEADLEATINGDWL